MAEMARTGIVGVSGGGADHEVADQVESVVDRHPWLEPLMRTGWAAKGLVYSLMGMLAVAIARAESSTDEEASPEGALSLVMERSFGRWLLAALAVGLVLYSAWRLVTVALVRGTGAKEWLERIGYTFSALFYVFLAWTAGRAAWAGRDPERSTTVERISASLLESTWGRILLGVGGIVVIAVGAYFAWKGVSRSFLDDLRFRRAGSTERTAVEASGFVGWVGRGVVTALVGLFVTVAAVQADPSEASGFDQSLRKLADGGWGSWLVFAAALGLIAYGVFCLLSLRHQRLD